MTPTHTTKGTRRYRYYACCTAQKRGTAPCPSQRIPAEPIETFVVERIRCVGRDPELLRQVPSQAREKDEISATDPLTRTSTTRDDAADNVIAQTVPLGHTTNSGYDPLNRQVTQTEGAGS